LTEKLLAGSEVNYSLSNCSVDELIKVAPDMFIDLFQLIAEFTLWKDRMAIALGKASRPLSCADPSRPHPKALLRATKVTFIPLKE
jgi:hypothetical protein